MAGGKASSYGASPGPGVDIEGRPVVDPTANVIALLESAVKRIDDLWVLGQKRQDDLRDAESRHVREVAKLRAEYAQELRHAESERIDAIRAVDVGAVNRASEVASQQASTLAAAVATSAETLRTQVAAAATAATVSLGAALVPIQEAVADLRRVQYEQQGQRAQVSETREQSTGTRQNLGLVIAALSFGAVFIFGIAGVAIALLLKH